MRFGCIVGRAPLTAVVAVLLLACSAPAALAHAAFLGSTPGPGARVERSPAEITMRFTEPLNRGLSNAKVVAVASGKRVDAASHAPRAKELIVRPKRRLATGAYRVEWHTVSTADGHALEGSFGFGVRAAAVGGAHQLEQSPLAREGWLRIALRGLFYASLFFFAGGVLVATILGRDEALGGWLVPEGLGPALSAAGKEPAKLNEQVAARTVDSGLFALAASVAVALEEAADAGGGFSLGAVRDFLLTNNAGIARVATVIALAAAVAAARRLPAISALACVFVFLTIALSGHANSAEQRLPAVLTDWAHLVGGTVWVGGIAQIATSWLPQVRAASGELRLAVMRGVLERFGRVAVPAFILVVTTGLVNALVQLGHPSALWETGYGRVLAVKVALVGLIAVASYLHALRLRPRLLAANPHPPARRERRHWRLFSAEPILALVVVLSAATLVAFPLPPRQLEQTDEAEAAGAPACDPCPLPRPRSTELGVADHAGSSIVAAWLQRDAAALAGRIRLLGLNETPVRARPRIAGARLAGCGPGCWRFRIRGHPDVLIVGLIEKGRPYTARLPARWQPERSLRARRILNRAQATMRGLRSVRQSETTTSGPGSLVETRYRLRAPDRFAYRTSGDAQSIVIGTRQWSRTPDVAWTEDRYGGGGPGFRTRSWFIWTNYAQVVRLLGTEDHRGRRLARLALMSPGTPLWYRLTVDLATYRVLRARMITGGHFMNHRFGHFNQPEAIVPPPTAGHAAR